MTATATVAVGRYLRAQRRVVMSRLHGLPALAAAAVILVITGAQIGTGRRDLGAALAALNVWVVAAGPLLTAVVAALVALVHRSARDGGMPWRGVHPATTVLGRVVVTVAWSLMVQVSAMAVWCVITLAAVDGAPATLVVARAVELATSLGVAGAGYSTVLAVAATVAPVLGPATIALLSVGSSIVAGESSGWQWVPGTWQMRSALGLIGTHVNGTALDGVSMPAGPAPIAGSVATSLLVVAGCQVLSHRTGRRPWRVVLAMTRGWTVPAGAAVAVGAVATTLRWRPPSDAAEVFALLVLPVGCTALATWTAVRANTGASAARPRLRRPWTVGLRLIVAMDGVVVLVVAAAAGTLLLAGVSLGPVLRAGAVWTVVGTMLVAMMAATAVIVGPATAVALGLMGTVVGALVGGSSLDGPMGPIVPWAWAAHTDGGSAPTTIALAGAIAITCSAVAADRMVRGRR